MKLIKPSVEYIPQEEARIYTHEDLYHHIDKCARVCYKSEGNYNPDKSKDFVEGLIKRGHLTPLEHATVYLTLNRGNKLYHELRDKYRNNPYSKVVNKGDNCYITTNFRVLRENGWLEDLTYRSFDTEYHVKRYTLKFICDRGVSHELVRHRRMSFAQESQRYCNYSKDKFGGVSFIEPSWFNSKDSSSEQREAFIQICQDSEECYLKLLDNWDNKKPDRRFKTRFKGNPLTPQQARGALLNATKTEIIITGFKEDWDHFFNLRYYGTTGKPHPDMQYIAKLAFDELESKSDYRCPKDNFYEGVTGTSFNKD